VDDMLRLVDAAVASGNPAIHMFLHSSTLLEERGEYNRHKIGRAELYQSIRAVVEHLQARVDVEFCTISEAAQRLQSR